MTLEERYGSQQLARIKLLAEWQFLEEIALDDPNEGVSLYYEDIGINCPWMDTSARFELTDEGAVKEYGEEFLIKWCDKANIALQDKSLLEKLKSYSENTTYHPKYPDRNPIEKFGLMW